MTSFSKRNNYASQESPIVVREDAPRGLREFIVQTLYALNHPPSTVRKVFCRVLRKSPNDSNWGEYPNIDRENRELIEECEWFRVYDLIEASYQQLDRKQEFAIEVNDYFKENGIGWKLEMVSSYIEVTNPLKLTSRRQLQSWLKVIYKRHETRYSRPLRTYLESQTQI